MVQCRRCKVQESYPVTESEVQTWIGLEGEQRPLFPEHGMWHHCPDEGYGLKEPVGLTPSQVFEQRPVAFHRWMGDDEKAEE